MKISWYINCLPKDNKSQANKVGLQIIQMLVPNVQLKSLIF